MFDATIKPLNISLIIALVISGCADINNPNAAGRQAPVVGGGATGGVSDVESAGAGGTAGAGSGSGSGSASGSGSGSGDDLGASGIGSGSGAGGTYGPGGGITPGTVGSGTSGGAVSGGTGGATGGGTGGGSGGGPTPIPPPIPPPNPVPDLHIEILLYNSTIFQRGQCVPQTTIKALVDYSPAPTEAQILQAWMDKNGIKCAYPIPIIPAGGGTPKTTIFFSNLDTALKYVPPYQITVLINPSLVNYGYGGYSTCPAGTLPLQTGGCRQRQLSSGTTIGVGGVD